MLPKHAELYGRVTMARKIARSIIEQADKLLELNDISDRQFDDFKDLTRSFMTPMALERETNRFGSRHTSPHQAPQESKGPQSYQTQQSE